MWKGRLGTQCHSMHAKVVELDKKCVSTPVSCFMLAIGYDYIPPTHIMISKLHWLCSAAYRPLIPDQTGILSLATIVLLSRLFLSVMLFPHMLLLLLSPSFFCLLLICSLSHCFPASQPCPCTQPLWRGRAQSKVNTTQLAPTLSSKYYSCAPGPVLPHTCPSHPVLPNSVIFRSPPCSHRQESLLGPYLRCVSFAVFI